MSVEFRVESVILFSVLSGFSMFKSTTLPNSTHSWMPIVHGSAPSVTDCGGKGLVISIL